MELCNKCYIVYEEKTCPLCNAMNEIKSLEKRIYQLEEELRNVEMA